MKHAIPPLVWGAHSACGDYQSLGELLTFLEHQPSQSYPWLSAKEKAHFAPNLEALTVAVAQVNTLGVLPNNYQDLSAARRLFKRLEGSASTLKQREKVNTRFKNILMHSTLDCRRVCFPEASTLGLARH